ISQRGHDDFGAPRQGKAADGQNQRPEAAAEGHTVPSPVELGKSALQFLHQRTSIGELPGLVEHLRVLEELLYVRPVQTRGRSWPLEQRLAAKDRKISTAQLAN